MPDKERFKLYKIFSIVGASMIYCLGRPGMFWGNLSVYVMSYLLSRKESNTLLQNSWFSFCYNISWMISMLLNKPLARFMKVRYCILLGVLIFNSFFIGSAYAAGVTWNVYLFSFGAVLGFGMGLYEGLVLEHYVTVWCKEEDRILTSLYMSSASIGGAVYNVFITWWANAKNVPPNFEKSSISLFSQDRILDRIPSMFLVSGGMNLALQLIGLSLLQDRNNKAFEDFADRHYETFGPDETVHESNNESRNGLTSGNQNTLLDFIQNRDFQKLWFIYFCQSHCNYVIGLNYKVYGQEWIKDDHFMANLGTALALSGIVFTVVWGFFMEKCGIKFYMIVISSLSSVSLFLMYFTAMLNKWLYFVCVCVGGNITSCGHLFLICSSKTLFGTNFFSRNLAVLTTATIMSTFSASGITEIMLASFGWFYVFFSIAMISVVALCCTLLTFPDM